MAFLATREDHLAVQKASFSLYCMSNRCYPVNLSRGLGAVACRKGLSVCTVLQLCSKVPRCVLCAAGCQGHSCVSGSIWPCSPSFSFLSAGLGIVVYLSQRSTQLDVCAQTSTLKLDVFGYGLIIVVLAWLVTMCVCVFSLCVFPC